MKGFFTIPRKYHGNGPVLFKWQSMSGNFLVTTGNDQVVYIFDRHGEKIYDLALPGTCCGISWDKDGTVLCLICEHSSSLLLWDSNTKSVTYVDSGFRDALTMVAWSKSAPLLAVGSLKGNLLIYTYRTSKKVTILGKHNKQITYGAWSQQNYLALVASDKTFTLSNADGDLVYRTTLKGEPSLVQFSSMKQDSSGGGETTVSLIMSKKSLFLLNIHDTEDPIVLTFQEKYGTVVDYCWHGEGNILLGFSSGFFIVLSTLLKEIGQELYHVQWFNNSLLHMAVCSNDNKVIGCGDGNKIKVYDLRNLQDMLHMVTIDDERLVDCIQWSDDGELLAVSGKEGNLHVYLTKLPVLGCAFNQNLAFLSSLYEVSVYSGVNKGDVKKLKIDIEPKFIALGMYHLAIGMNNRAWFYKISDTDKTELLYDREYLSTVHSLYLNCEYASALIEGKIQLHIIDEPNSPCIERESRIFPDADQKNTIITCHALTNDFLIFGTDTGTIQLFSLMEWNFALSINHPLNSAIKLLCPDVPGTRILVVDSKSSGFIYNPVDSSLLSIPDFRPNVKKVLWDNWPHCKGVFMTFDEERADSFIYIRDSIEGSKVERISSLAVNDIYPGLLLDGELIFLTPAGKTSSLTVPGLRVDVNDLGHDETTLNSNFKAALQVRRFDQALALATNIDSAKLWNELAGVSILNFELGTALQAYRKVGNARKILVLEEIKGVEDKSLLAGHISEFLLKTMSMLKKLYLMSSFPMAALEMCKSLHQWDSALKLAVTLSPNEVPYISRENAEQLELKGNYTAARRLYEKGLVENVTGPEVEHHNHLCKSGIARTSLRCNDYKR
ncbi:LOW QUALITY PROTEIN: WD repeat-containing protein 19-like [Uloborus diversus]|uniref:LOW QUALITY PROTEIN: WD repeat-containing protein 19-like n=1 Tax=Uloborus diversus TaxID=327109 RepID=UPI002409DA0D|nr:LOW QUALITY PROTEIN: WD repeat-containing protein 19-like [Uloborus diversus]